MNKIDGVFVYPLTCLELAVVNKAITLIDPYRK